MSTDCATTIKRGVTFTLPIWKARRRGERTLYATVTRVAGNRVWTDYAGTFRKDFLEQHAEVQA